MPLCQIKHAPRRRRPRFKRLDRMRQVIDRARERGHMQNTIDFAIDGQWLADIMLSERHPAPPFEMSQVLAMTGNQIVKSDNFMAGFDEPLAQM